MRRIVALLIMLIVPLQFTWAAAAGVYGHAGQDTSSAGFHAHDNGHDHADGSHHEHAASSEFVTIDSADDCHHGHVHPVFFSLPAKICSLSTVIARNGPVRSPTSRFLSRTPPLLDRPPLALA